MQSPVNEETYVDSFFLPEGILDSDDDDGNLQLDKDVGGAGDNSVGREFVLPSFLRTQKATWSAPPLLIPSRTDEVVSLYATGDDLESNPSLHSASRPAQWPPDRRLPTREEPLDGLSQHFEKEQEILYHNLTPSLVGSDRSSFSTQASPPPGFESKIHLQSPRSGATSSTQPTKSATQKGGPSDSIHSRESTPLIPHSSPPFTPLTIPPPPFTRAAARDEQKDERKSYARVAAEAKASDNELLRRKEKVGLPASIEHHPPISLSRENAAQHATTGDATAPSVARSLQKPGASQVTSSATASSTPLRASAKQRQSHRRHRKSKAALLPSGAEIFGHEESGRRQQPPQKRASNIVSSTSSLMDSLSSQPDDEGGGDQSLSNGLARSEAKPFGGRPQRADEPRERRSTDDNAETRRAAISLSSSEKITTLQAVTAASNVMSTIVLAFDAGLALFAGCLSLFGSVFNGTAKGLILLALGLASTCHYAAAEIRDGAASCYSAFLLLPLLCDLLMATFSLPHFTPHFISTITVCQLCRPSSNRKSAGARSRFASYDRPAEAVSRSVLRIVRYLLLLLEIVEGFAESNMSYMTAEIEFRILASYLLALARSNLLLSPVGWTSWSVQLLAAYYVRKNLATELLLILIGMASVQLCRQVQTEDNFVLQHGSLSGSEDRIRGTTRSTIKKANLRL